jgi:hypothetical protein
LINKDILSDAKKDKVWGVGPDIWLLQGTGKPWQKKSFLSTISNRRAL